MELREFTQYVIKFPSQLDHLVERFPRHIVLQTVDANIHFTRNKTLLLYTVFYSYVFARKEVDKTHKKYCKLRHQMSPHSSLKEFTYV